MVRDCSDSPVWDSDPTSGAKGVVLAVDGETTVIRLRGEIDAAHRSELETAARFAIVVGGAVRVDVAGMTSMDSTVIDLFTRLLRAGRRPEVVGAGRRASELLEVAGIRHAVDLR
jgi:anti-anti-sigma regulatory factor